ncbi:MAG: SAM-dependent methyltransferase [Lachnospiraceae bacterium]|nr:SAM-dependent methyltransferase [Lachnospiraceae bacterium]
MRKIAISERLKKLADMVQPGHTVADVGCDHGWLSIYLVWMGISPKAVAMDLRKGPLSAAKAHVSDYGLGSQIDIRLSNGLQALEPGEAQTILLAGMGGRLMLEILKAGWEKLMGAEELILQPQSDIPLVRSFLRLGRFPLLSEDILLEDGKYYFPMKARILPEAVLDISLEMLQQQESFEDRYGFLLLKERPFLFLKYLEKEEARLSGILDQMKEAGKRGDPYQQTERLLEETRKILFKGFERR